MNMRSIAAAILAVAALTASAAPAASAATPPITPDHASPPAGGTVAIGTGVDAGNQNAQLAESLPAQMYPSWSAQPPLCPSAATSVPLSISVTSTQTVVVDRGYQCSYVSSYATATGALQWRRSYHFAGPSEVVGSSVYVTHDSAAGMYVDALSLATGAVKWSKPSGDPTETDGVAADADVVASDSIVFSASNGARRFAPAGGGTPIVAGGMIYVNGSAAVRAYAETGALKWTYVKPVKSGIQFGPGYGTSRPSLHDGILYVTSAYGDSPSSTAKTLAINAATGKLALTLPASATPLAFDGNVGITTNTAHGDSTIVSAYDLRNGTRYWTTNPSFPSGPAVVTSSPIIENGLVWSMAVVDTGTPARLIALDEVTGAVRNTITEPCHAAQSGLVIAQHRLFASSDCGVITFSTTKPAELLADPGMESGNSAWQPLPGSTLTRVTTPVHGGTHALKVTPSAQSQYVSGVSANAVIPNSIAGKLYTLSCWVRGAQTGLDLRAQVRELSHDLSTETYQPTTTLGWVPAGSWFQLSVSARAARSGDRMVPQVMATGANANSISTFIDDCTLTTS